MFLRDTGFNREVHSYALDSIGHYIDRRWRASLARQYIPMARSIKSILNAVVVIVVVVWVLNVFGLMDSIQSLQIGRN